MYHLRRLHLDCIGVSDNRFSDLTVELTDLAGDPTDSIVWLRNGAGKTTMLSLLLALVLPDRRDFLATRTKNRTLEDLVLGGDTAHVAAEWVDRSGRVLLTGAVYEWTGRTRPRDYNGPGKDRLNRMFWCVSPDPMVDGSTLDELPFTTRARGRVDLDGFKSHIRGLATQGVNATVADKTITEWHDALRERNFDPELFRYFAELNATEGGMDALFSRIDSAGAFVRYLLRFVGDERRTAPVRDLLSDTATEIAKRPVYLAEGEFCAEAQPRIEALGTSHARVLSAAAERAEVRFVAAGYKRALTEAAATADSGREHATALHAQLVDVAREASTAAGDTRRQRDEYLRLAAVFRQQAAEEAHAEAERRVASAKLENAAWSVVTDLVDLRAAQAALASRRDALRAAEKEAAPLHEQLEAANRVLAGALDAAVADADAALGQGTKDETDAVAAKEEADAERLAARDESARLDAEGAQLAGRIEIHDAARAELAPDAGLGPAEALDVAADRLAREHAAAAQRHEELLAERDGLASARRVAHAELRERRDEARAAARHADGLAGELARVQDRAAELAGLARVREVAQAETPDVAGASADITAALDEAAAVADAALLAARAAAAADEHAVHALSAEGLLPPRAAVSVVVAALAESGVTAYPGWRYLAENEPAASHQDLIAALPEVCDGVVVYGDPVRAAAAVEGIDVDDVVVLAPATAFRTPGTPCTVIGPAAARHDPSAGEAELVDRRRRLTIAHAQIDRLAAERETDARLAQQLRAFAADLPADGMAGLAHRAGAAEEAAEAARGAENDATAHIDAVDARAENLVAEITDAQRTTERLDRLARRVATLAATEADVINPARARLDAIPALRNAALEAEGAARRRYEEADKLIQAIRDRLRGIRQTRQTLAIERAGLADAADPGGVGVEEARARSTETASLLAERSAEPELRRQVDAAETDVAVTARRWERHDTLVRSRAEALADTPAGADPTLRAEEADRARAEEAEANQALGAKKAECEAAEADLAAKTPRDRPRHTDPPVTPVDRAHAQALAAEAEEEATRRQQAVSRAERQRDAAQADAERHRIRAAMLRDQAEQLRSVEEADTPVGPVPADDDAARAKVREIAAELDAREASHISAVEDRTKCAESLRTWAGGSRFTRLADDENGQAVRQLRDMFCAENRVEIVAPRCEELAAALAARQGAIAQQLAHVESHKRNVVARLAGLVEDGLSVIVRASSLSELPAGVGPWGGLRFLDVAPRQRPTRDQIVLRAGELVDRMVSAGKVEIEPAELLWRAVEASVPEGFRATVLKPAPDQPTGRTPVENMRKWSGGENLTASLVLFIVLTRLRAEQRSGTRAGAKGGVVPLDNPLGKANYLPFLQLQRDVAAANGVQLVFWTGIGDLGAVTAFPRIAAMHKRPSATRPGAAYVRIDPASSHAGPPDGAVVEVATAVRAEP